MTTTLVLPEWIEARVQRMLDLVVETGAVLLVRPVRAPSGHTRLLAVRLEEVPHTEYLRREPYGMQIGSGGYVPALGLAERIDAIPIWFHTHPGEFASPRPSAHDEHVDEQLREVFRLRSGSEVYGALILSRAEGLLRFSGHIDEAARSTPIDRMLIVGARVRLIRNDDQPERDPEPMFDRSIRAFGGQVQAVLGDLKIAVVGCGGTGSCVAEQLVRLGVRHLTLVDPDVLSESNLTRVYGSTVDAVGTPKVEVVRSHLRRIAPTATIDVTARMITEEAGALSLAGVDLVFGCTDDNAGRMVLSRLSSYLLTPVIDCGVILASDESGRLEGIHGRVTLLYPGVACLVCRGRIDLARAASEVLTPTERRRLIDEGYAPALHGVEPAVVTYTTMVAAAAVGELLERLVGYGVEDAPSEVLLRVHDREISTNVELPQRHHYCHPDAGKVGLGLTEPFLEQTWPA